MNGSFIQLRPLNSSTYSRLQFFFVDEARWTIRPPEGIKTVDWGVFFFLFFFATQKGSKGFLTDTSSNWANFSYIYSHLDSPYTRESLGSTYFLPTSLIEANLRFYQDLSVTKSGKTMRLFRSTSLAWLVICVLVLTFTTDAMGFLSNFRKKSSSSASSSRGFRLETLKPHMSPEDFEKVNALWKTAVDNGWFDPVHSMDPISPPFMILPSAVTREKPKPKINKINK